MNMSHQKRAKYERAHSADHQQLVAPGPADQLTGADARTDKPYQHGPDHVARLGSADPPHRLVVARQEDHRRKHTEGHEKDGQVAEGEGPILEEPQGDDGQFGARLDEEKNGQEHEAEEDESANVEIE